LLKQAILRCNGYKKPIVDVLYLTIVFEK